MIRRFAVVLALAAGLLTASVRVARAADATLDFQPDTSFPQLPEEFTLGVCTGVGVNKQGDVFLLHRGKNPIICLDSTGKYQRSWGDDLMASGHGLKLDRDENVWVTDTKHHVVYKFSPQGKLLLALGTVDQPGLGTHQFDQPTDVAFGPDGEIFVTDGYGNSRVMKFNSSGKFLKTWGTPGKETGQFDAPHTVLIDPDGRVLIGDRENDRIQIFDSEGNHLETWPGFAPFGLVMDGNGDLFVADGRAHKVLQLDRAGRVVGSWGGEGSAPGEFDVPHMLAADRDNNLYVVEINGERIQKLVRRR